MRLCLSPFPLEPALQHRLEGCGWEVQGLSPLPEPLPAEALVVYDAPDRLLAASDLQPEDLLLGYRQLLELPVSVRLISAWRLEACSDGGLRAGLDDALLEQPWPAPEPLAAMITKLALDSLPGLLDGYLDLELRADLLGGEPDAHYRRRLLADLSFDELLAAWRAPAALSQASAELEAQLAEAREEAELTLLQLHQVQEELEHYFLLSRGQSQQLERYDALQQRSHRLLARCLNAPAAAPAG